MLHFRLEPADWDTYTTKQKDKWNQKSFDEKRELALKSYLPLIMDENGNLDVMKVLDCIITLQDDVEDLKCTCVREYND